MIWIWLLGSYPANWALLWAGRKLAESYGKTTSSDNNMAILGMWVLFSPMTVFVTAIVALPLLIRFWFEAASRLFNFDFGDFCERVGRALFSEVEVRDVQADR